MSLKGAWKGLASRSSPAIAYGFGYEEADLDRSRPIPTPPRGTGASNLEWALLQGALDGNTETAQDASRGRVRVVRRRLECMGVAPEGENASFHGTVVDWEVRVAAASQNGDR